MSAATIINSVMLATLALASLALHEAGHGLVLRGLGIPLSEAGLGLPIGRRLRLALKPTTRRPFTLTISPLLIGAYVKPDERYRGKLDSLPYWDAAWYSGAGVITNLVWGFSLYAVGAVLFRRPVEAAIGIGLAVLVWFARRILVAYVVPVAGIGLLGAFLYTEAAGSNAHLRSVFASMVTSPATAISAAGVISVAWGLFNMVPLMPLDGGRIVRMLIARWAGKRTTAIFDVAGLVIFGLFITYDYGSTAIGLVAS